MRYLRLPAEHHVVAGSGSLVLHGVVRTRPMGDLDIYIKTASWFELLYSGEWGVFIPEPLDKQQCCDPPYLVKIIEDLEINVFHTWRFRSDGIGNIDTAQWIQDAVIHYGIPCVPIRNIFYWKVQVAREKDNEDLVVLSRIISEA